MLFAGHVFEFGGYEFLRENDLTYSKVIAAMRDWMFYGLLREPEGAPAK